MIVYYDTPYYSVAHNPKVACTSLARAIIEEFYPDIYSEILKSSTNLNSGIWIIRCPCTVEPTKPVLCLIREPIDRFKSALRQTELTADTAIKHLKTGAPYKFAIYSRPRKLAEDGHFRRQLEIVRPRSFLFQYPRDLKALVQIIGLKDPLPHLNKGRSTIELTIDQVEFANQWYAEDLNLYYSIDKPMAVYHKQSNERS